MEGHAHPEGHEQQDAPLAGEAAPEGARRRPRQRDDEEGVTPRRAPSGPAPISFAMALQRVRSLRQHTALLQHLYELVIARFMDTAVGTDEPEYTVALGQEQVVVEVAIVEEVLTLLSDDMDRLRFAQRQLESSVVIPRGSRTADRHDGSGEAVADGVINNDVATRSRTAKKKTPGDAP